MPVIQSVLECALAVDDVRRAVAFYQGVLGLPLMEEFDGGRGAAFAVRGTVLLLFRTEVTLQEGDLPPHGTTGSGHVAFRVAPDELPRWREHLIQRGVRIEKEHRFGSNPPSIYFRDPDGNLLELAVDSIWPWPRE